MKRTCEVCVREIPMDALRCVYCNSPQSKGLSIKQKSSSSPSRRILLIALLGAIGGAVVIGLYWKFKINPRLEGLGVVAPDTKTIRKTLDLESESEEYFDRKVSLPSEPLGFAFGRNEFVLGNRKDPWGFMRIARSEDEFELSTVPVHETNYMQRVSFHTVAWNGKNYVSVTTGSWFNSPSKDVFCKHDPKTLKIISTVPAPEQLGCLAYDGIDYWGATRSNTLTSGEPVYLYRFDSDLKEISRHAAPAKGCQGLAWDGQFLWFADVFDDSIYVLDTTPEEPSVVHRIPTPYSYLSGVAFDGSDIWVSEYQNHEIHRLNPALRTKVAKLGGRAEVPGVFVSSDSSSEQQTSDSYTNSSPEYPEEEVDVHEFSAEISNGAIYASWKIHFGEKLFESHEAQNTGFSMPLFRKYSVTVTGPGLSQASERTFDAQPGMNEESNVAITDVGETGEYSVVLFIHVQYVRPDGGNQILNKTASPLTLHY